jgi:hypothetical protein
MRRRRRPSRSSAREDYRWADDNSATADSGGEAVAVIELRDGTPKGMDWLGFYYDTRLEEDKFADKRAVGGGLRILNRALPPRIGAPPGIGDSGR